MKGLFKLTTAALALLTMASCSQDDLLSNKQDIQAPENGELRVELEDLIDPITTRAAFVPESNTKNTVYWQTSDIIKVQDESLVKYDLYRFNAKKGSFLNNDADGVTRVGAPKYALFPGYGMDGEWEYSDDANVITYDIPQTITYRERADIVDDGTIAFQSEVPMWGDAAAEGEGVKVSLRYLTAVLRVYLKNAHANVDGFKVEAFADQACTQPLAINGATKAKISKGDEVLTDAQLEMEDRPLTLGTDNVITVVGIKNGYYPASGDAYLYIPLIAQPYAALKFYYTTDASVASPVWKLIKTTKPMTLKRQNVYRLSLESFEVSGDEIEGINAILKSEVETTGDLNITTQNETNLDEDDRVIIIPAGMKASNITLDLKGITGGTSTDDKILEIESEDGKYAGNIILDLGDGTVTNLSNIYVNLPKGNLTIIGNFGSTHLGLGNTSGNPVDDKMIVKSVTVSQPEGVTSKVGNIYLNKEAGEGATDGAIKIGEGALANGIFLDPQEGNKLTSIVVDGTLTTALDATKVDSNVDVTVGAKGVTNNISTKGAVTVNGGKAEAIVAGGDITIAAEEAPASYNAKTLTTPADITVSGKAKVNASVNSTAEGEAAITISDEATVGTIDAQSSVGAKAYVTVTISDKAASTGDIKNPTGKVVYSTEKAFVGTTFGVKDLELSSKGKLTNVTIPDNGSALINVDDQSTDGTGACEAITGTLTVGKKAKITLTQGYIGTITPQATAAADACTLTFGEGEGYTAIKTVSNDYIKPQNASTWNGKVLPNKTYVGGQVWTACQLATVNLATANLTLKNNIDLGGETAWAMPALAKDFFGFDMKGYGVLTETTYPTISNVKILNKDSKNADIDNAGLFSTITGTIAVKDFNITNATLTLTGAKKNAGILAGSATGTGLWVTNVNVSGSIETTAKFDNVGGLIGQAEAPWIGWTYPSTLDTKVVSVTLTKLQGRYNIGGVIGNTTSTAYFNKTKVDIAENGITVVDAKSFDVDVASDTKAGCVGMILGKADGNVRIDEANIVADRIAGKKEALGFKARYKTNATPQILFYFGGTAKNALGDAAGDYYAGTTKIEKGADATAAPAKATDKNAPSRFVLSGKYADWDK